MKIYCIEVCNVAGCSGVEDPDFLDTERFVPSQFCYYSVFFRPQKKFLKLCNSFLDCKEFVDVRLWSFDCFCDTVPCLEDSLYIQTHPVQRGGV